MIRYLSQQFEVNFPSRVLTLTWFHPAVPAAAHYHALREQKVGKAQAREQARQAVRQAYQRHVSHGHTWAECMLVVTAYRSGLVLGRAVLSGMASDADSLYLNERGRELAAEALEEAWQTLACLAPPVQERLFGSAI